MSIVRIHAALGTVSSSSLAELEDAWSGNHRTHEAQLGEAAEEFLIGAVSLDGSYTVRGRAPGKMVLRRAAYRLACEFAMYEVTDDENTTDFTLRDKRKG
jgi:hypothetical protein